MNQIKKTRKKPDHYKIKLLSEKQKAVELYLRGGIPVAEIARQFGICTSTLTQNWVKQVARGRDRLLGGSKKITDDFKLKVVRKVLSGGISVQQAAEVYGIASPATVSKWMHQFNSDISVGISQELINPKHMGINMKSNARDDGDNDALKKALRDAQLKIVALETMITLAEEQFKIDIRKKFGTKQSE
jgi:transposase